MTRFFSPSLPSPKSPHDSLIFKLKNSAPPTESDAMSLETSISDAIDSQETPYDFIDLDARGFDLKMVDYPERRQLKAASGSMGEQVAPQRSSRSLLASSIFWQLGFRVVAELKPSSDPDLYQAIIDALTSLGLVCSAGDDDSRGANIICIPSLISIVDISVEIAARKLHTKIQN